MIGKVDPIEHTARDYQANFLTDNLPPGSEGFYNTKAFAANETRFLSTLISEDNQAAQRGQNAIKDSIESLA